MTTLILGADRASLRLILDRDGQVSDDTLLAQALDRNELEHVQAALAKHNVTWAEIDRLGVLILPHSHTSVRITTTLLAVAGWVYDRPLVHIDVPELDSGSATTLLGRLTADGR